MTLQFANHVHVGDFVTLRPVEGIPGCRVQGHILELVNGPADGEYHTVEAIILDQGAGDVGTYLVEEWPVVAILLAAA